MKKLFPFSLVLLTAVFAASCNGSGDKDAADSAVTDSANIAKSSGFLLEDLLTIPNEKALIEKYGAAHVKYDTIWGAEGAYDVGSYLDKSTDDEVQILWKDSAGRSGIAIVMIQARYHSDGKATFDNKWSSASGVKLGMNVTALEKLNGKSFVFSGLDWDYGGGVNFNDGALAKKNVGVTLGHSTNESQLTEEEMSVLIGDHDVKSDEAVVQKVQPVVVQLNVWP